LARLENDVALRSDVLRVEVRLAEAEEALEIARNNLERAESRLNLAMGQSITDPLLLAGGEVTESFPRHGDASLEELIGQAHRDRPDIEAIDRSIEALEYAVRAAKADYYPHVNAFAHYDVDSEDFSDSNDSWTIGIGASLSIFDGFLTRSNVRSSQAQLREAEARKVLFREIARLRQDGPRREEVERAVRYLQGRHSIALQGNVSRAVRYVDAEVRGPGVESVLCYPERIAAVACWTWDPGDRDGGRRSRESPTTITRSTAMSREDEDQPTSPTPMGWCRCPT